MFLSNALILLRIYAIIALSANKRGYGKMYANCRKINLSSQSLLRKTGFEEFDMTKEQYLGIEIKVDDIDKNYAFVYTLK